MANQDVMEVPNAVVKIKKVMIPNVNAKIRKRRIADVAVEVKRNLRMVMITHILILMAHLILSANSPDPDKTPLSSVLVLDLVPVV